VSRLSGGAASTAGGVFGEDDYCLAFADGLCDDAGEWFQSVSVDAIAANYKGINCGNYLTSTIVAS